MEEAFNVEYRGDHVHVQLGKGYKLDSEWRDELWSKLAEACRTHNSSRVFVEGYVPGGNEISTVDVIKAGQYTAIVPHLWLAFHLDDFEPSESSELFEVIAASKGARVKFFSDGDSALNWLRANAPG